MKASKALVALVIAVLLIFAAFAATLLLDRQVIDNVAEVKCVNVIVFTYENDSEQVVERINWGMIDSNATAEIQVFARSDSNVPIVLTTSYGNWTPLEMGDYTTNWSSLDNVTMQPDEVMSLTFYMHIAAEITSTDIREFSFEIIIDGTEI